MPAKKTARITLNIFDGTRRLINPRIKTRVILRDGGQRIRHDNFHRAQTINFTVPFANSLTDRYTLIVSADQHTQSGWTPIKLSPAVAQVVDLMMVPKNCAYDFTDAAWPALKVTHPVLSALLTSGASEIEAAARYDELQRRQPDALACLLNLATALDDVQLQERTALAFYRQVIWHADSLRPNRCFAFADARLLDEIERATQQGWFTPAHGFDLFHPGATRSYKQKQFGAGNLQLTFHENETARIGGVDCIKVETDLDYFKNAVAHFFIEVLKNALTGSKTEPKAIYVYRWIESRRPGVREFTPPYRLLPAAVED